MEFRCPGNKLHGMLIIPGQGGEIEFRCRSVFCGAGAGVVVTHRYSTTDATLISTTRFKDPIKKKGAK